MATFEFYLLLFNRSMTYDTFFPVTLTGRGSDVTNGNHRNGFTKVINNMQDIQH